MWTALGHELDAFSRLRAASQLTGAPILRAWGMLNEGFECRSGRCRAGHWRATGK